MHRRSQKEYLDHKQQLHQKSFNDSKRFQSEFMRILQQEEEMQNLLEDALVEMAAAQEEEEFAKMDIKLN
jgi:vacuolar-type H+-ATPase catalytic subunit A/Vma1